MTRTKYFLLCTCIAFVSLSCKKTSGDKASISDSTQIEKSDGDSYQVDLNTSQVFWQGTKPTGTHNGVVKLSQGELVVDNGQVTGGSFILDMNSITVNDLEGDMKASLEAHLKGTTEGKEDDFFNVTLYPTARFEISKISALSNDPQASHLVYGNLSLRDKTKEIGFKANINISDKGVKVSTPQFTINRADWGIKHMSKSFFDDLKDKFINDEVGLRIQLVAAK